MPTPPLTTRARLVIAFGLILATTALAHLALLHATSRIRSALDEVRRSAQAEHAGFVLGALAREEYLHQAHILMSEDDSHLGHYRETVAAFEDAARSVATAVGSDAERRWLAEITATNARIHRRLEDEIRPALARGDRAAVHRLHDQTEAEVDRIVHLAGDLSAAFKHRMDASTSRAQDLWSAAWGRMLIVPPLLLLLALAAGAWILRSVDRPLIALQRGVHQISQGDRSTRIALGGNDEFSALARCINRMVEDLKTQQERLIQSEKLAGLGRLAAGVAHELNNPLGVILGYLRLLSRRPLDPPVAEQVQIIEDEALQCLRIVEGLRDHVRPLVLDGRPLDIVPLLRETVRRLESSMPAAQVRLEAPESRLLVVGDELRLRQVMTNLLRNALEASPAGAPVTVRAALQGGWVCFSVHDEGSGIPEAHRAQLFEPFFTTKAQGSGLGLSICDSIVRVHGGEIVVDSVERQGATFTVRLPAALPGNGRAAHAPRGDLTM